MMLSEQFYCVHIYFSSLLKFYLEEGVHFPFYENEFMKIRVIYLLTLYCVELETWAIQSYNFCKQKYEGVFENIVGNKYINI